MAEAESKCSELLAKAVKLMKNKAEEIQKYEKGIEELQRHYQRSSFESDKEIERLQCEIASLEAEVESVEKMRSASRQARKIHGDIVPGDQTHADIALQYKNHFKEEHRNLPKSLSTCKIPKYKESFNETKRKTASLMMSEVQKALLADHAHSDMTEDTHDLLQAFDILLKYIDIDTKMKEKVIEELRTSKTKYHYNEAELLDAVEFALLILQKLPSEQHRSVLESDKAIKKASKPERKIKTRANDDTQQSKSTQLPHDINDNSHSQQQISLCSQCICGKPLSSQATRSIGGRSFHAGCCVCGSCGSRDLEDLEEYKDFGLLCQKCAKRQL